MGSLMTMTSNDLFMVQRTQARRNSSCVIDGPAAFAENPGKRQSSDMILLTKREDSMTKLRLVRGEVGKD